MTNQNNEQEVIELAKMPFITHSEMTAFRRAALTLRENDAKMIAMLVNIFTTIERCIEEGMASSDILDENSPIRDAIRDSISAAQPTAEAFMAEHDARVLEELHRRYSECSGKLSLAVISTSMIDEKRKQGKEGVK